MADAHNARWFLSRAGEPGLESVNAHIVVRVALVWLARGKIRSVALTIVALDHRSSVLYTIFTNISGVSFSKVTMRPNPRARGAVAIITRLRGGRARGARPGGDVSTKFCTRLAKSQPLRSKTQLQHKTIDF